MYVHLCGTCPDTNRDNLVVVVQRVRLPQALVRLRPGVTSRHHTTWFTFVKLTSTTRTHFTCNHTAVHTTQANIDDDLPIAQQGMGSPVPLQGNRAVRIDLQRVCGVCKRRLRLARRNEGTSAKSERSE